MYVTLPKKRDWFLNLSLFWFSGKEDAFMPAYSNTGYETCDYLGTETIPNHGDIDIYYCENSLPFPAMVAKANDDPTMSTTIPVHLLLSDIPVGFPPITKILKKYYLQLN